MSDKALATSKEPAVTAITLTTDENKKLLSVSQAGLTVYDWPRLSPERNIKLQITNPHAIAVSSERQSYRHRWRHTFRKWNHRSLLVARVKTNHEA